MSTFDGVIHEFPFIQSPPVPHPHLYFSLY